jgi:hypothetical protein
MGNKPRGLRETAVRALAKVGLVWAIAVLGALFMTTSAEGQYDDGSALASAGAAAKSTSISVTSGGAPSTAGLALALVLLGSGVIVLAVGASRGDRDPKLTGASEPDPGFVMLCLTASPGTTTAQAPNPVVPARVTTNRGTTERALSSVSAPTSPTMSPTGIICSAGTRSNTQVDMSVAT